MPWDFAGGQGGVHTVDDDCFQSYLMVCLGSASHLPPFQQRFYDATNAMGVRRRISKESAAQSDVTFWLARYILACGRFCRRAFQQ